MTVPINCFDCGHRHELQDHVYNNLLWDNQDVFCGKCGKKLRAGIQPKKTPIIPTNEKKEVEAVEDVNLQEEVPIKKTESLLDGDGLFFVMLYLFAWVAGTFLYGSDGFSVGLVPFVLFGVGCLLHKWGERM